tara:strand:- start:30936 stop:31160 length:225 start_codon:yes stop_codon:yes gene_type:complete
MGKPMRFSKPTPRRSGEKNIDYKDLDSLKPYVMDNGKIIPRRITGASAKAQRAVAVAVKRSRYLALIAFCDNHE